MSDNPDTDRKQYSPHLHWITDPSGDGKRLPVLQEDYEIENEVFRNRAHITTVSKRTNEEIVEYLTKAFYDPEHAGGFSIPFVAHKKAERVYDRDYPQDVARDMAQLYIKAKGAFTIWWEHLEDDADRNEVDEDTVKLEYIREFMEKYVGQLWKLDRDHSGNGEVYERHMGQNKVIRKYVDASGGEIHRKQTDYERYKPRWKQYIAADGRADAVEAASEDAEIGMGFRSDQTLEKLAVEWFGKCWKQISDGMYIGDQLAFDYTSLRMIYTHNFMTTYAARAAGGQASSGEGEASARIVTSHLDQDTRVYLIEINDPQHLTAPVRAEVAVTTEDDVQMRGETDDAG
jgi:hypothetical protein